MSTIHQVLNAESPLNAQASQLRPVLVFTNPKRKKGRPRKAKERHRESPRGLDSILRNLAEVLRFAAKEIAQERSRKGGRR